MRVVTSDREARSLRALYSLRRDLFDCRLSGANGVGPDYRPWGHDSE